MVADSDTEQSTVFVLICPKCGGITFMLSEAGVYDGRDKGWLYMPRHVKIDKSSIMLYRCVDCNAVLTSDALITGYKTATEIQEALAHMASFLAQP